MKQNKKYKVYWRVKVSDLKINKTWEDKFNAMGLGDSRNDLLCKVEYLKLEYESLKKSKVDMNIDLINKINNMINILNEATQFIDSISKENDEHIIRRGIRYLPASMWLKEIQSILEVESE